MMRSGRGGESEPVADDPRPPSAPSFRRRLGNWLIRHDPWPHVVILGGGGVLLVLDNLWWDRPDQPLRLWLGVGLGIAAVVLGVAHVWIHLSAPE